MREKNIIKVGGYYYKFSFFLSNTKVFSWIFTCLSLLIAFFVFFYFDINDTMNNSLLLIDAIRDGQFFHYYDYAIINVMKGTIYTADYNLPIYFLFAIWNIPVYIVKNLWGLEGIFFVAAYLWCKLLIVLGTIGCIKKVIDLLEEVNYKSYSKQIVCLLFASSSALLLGAFIAVQYDILTLFLILSGMDAYIKNQNKKFILIFMLAVPFKMFSLFIFIPMLLLKEKRVFKIIFNSIKVYALVIIEKVIYWNDSAYIMCMKTQNKQALKLMIGGSMKIGKHKLVFFLIAFIILCVYCYNENRFIDLQDDVKGLKLDLLYHISYIGFFVFSIFLISVNFRSYWIVLYLPFAILVMAMNYKDMWLNFLLETIGSTACVLYLLMKHKIYSISKLCTRLLLAAFKNIPEKENLKYGNVTTFLTKYIGEYKELLFTVFVATMLVMLFINYPKRVKLEYGETQRPATNLLKGTIFRSLISLALTCIVIYGSVKGQNPIMITTSNAPTVSTLSVMDGNIFKQEFKAIDDRELNSLTLKFQNKLIAMKNRGSIVITIKSLDDESILYQERVGQALIKNNKLFDISLKDISVEKNKVYEITIEKNEHNFNSQKIYPYLNSGVKEGMEPILINGEQSNSNLFMILR